MIKTADKSNVVRGLQWLRSHKKWSNRADKKKKKLAKAYPETRDKMVTYWLGWGDKWTPKYFYKVIFDTATERPRNVGHPRTEIDTVVFGELNMWLTYTITINNWGYTFGDDDIVKLLVTK